MEYVAIALSALGSALGAITLWILSGLRNDIAAIRSEIGDVRSQASATRETLYNLVGRFDSHISQSK